ncbi:TonB-dependent receptor, partial [Myroides odoratimimus]|nr:TonB-dependent receptor [Myroides odoratimimus]
SVFFNLNIGYQPSKINVANQGYYDKDYTWSNKVAQDIKMDKLYLNTRVSKLFSELKTTLALSTSYEYYKSDIWQQNTLFTNYSNQWTVGFEAFVKKLDWMSIQYIISDNIFWENNQFRNTDKLHNITQQVNLSFFTLKNVQLQLSGEHNYNDMGGKESYKNFFIDATASYKLKQVEFTALLQNLLDKKEYSYTSYTGLNSSSLKIPIRGRSILLGATFSF